MIKRLLCWVSVFVMMIASTSPLTAKADTMLDEIQEYNITVDMESDGSMDITYHIEWKVLDDTSEGPLTWVKIGIPNKHVNNIKALSDNISGICYYSSGGDYIRIDLDRNYYAGEIVTIDFSIHQAIMYTLNSDLYYFYFTPGWFEEIDVKAMTILWNSKDALFSEAPSKNGEYFMWTASLAAGEKLTACVVYRADAFDTILDVESINSTSYNPVQGSGDSGFTFYIIVAIIAIVVRIVVRILFGGGYRGGFGHGGHYGGHGGFGGGCACAGCACACACAGGGRAGCSVKNFYSSAAQVDRLKQVLQQNQDHIRT